jgi:hypothetical protein
MSCHFALCYICTILVTQRGTNTAAQWLCSAQLQQPQAEPIYISVLKKMRPARTGNLYLTLHVSLILLTCQVDAWWALAR